MEPMEYYVMRNDDNVTMWLDADEKTWTAEFGGAAAFTSAELANAIAKRELGDDRVFYVMGAMPSMDDD
jgi:hypothetical protein